MIKTRIFDVLTERMRIATETQDNWDHGIAQCRKRILDILAVDFEKTVLYFSEQCDDEEFYWLSEVFEDIAKETQSKELIAVWRKRLAQVSPETYDQTSFRTEHMRQWVDYAEYVRSIEEEIRYAEGQLTE